MKKFRNYVRTHATGLIVATFGLSLLAGLLLFRLGSQTFDNAATLELATKSAAASWQTILADPLYAPYSVGVRILAMAGYDGLVSLRLVSTLFAGLAAVLFYSVARQWHSLRVALLASWLFVTSAWFLHVGRLGSPEILWLVSMLAVVVVLTPNKNGRQTRLALPSTLGVLGLVLYVPGMVWLVVCGAVLQRKNIREAWSATAANWQRGMSILLTVVVVAPLGYALARNPGLIRSWLGFSQSLQPDAASARLIGENIIGVPKDLFYGSSFDPVHWLGGLPLLSSFEIIMFLLGLYFYVTRLRAARSRLIIVLAGVGCLLVGISGPTAISLIIPVIYLLAAAGIAYIIHVWLKVFPVNPVARSIGIGLVMAAVLLTSLYQTRSYFVAWRYNEATSQSFQIKL